jgi:hypothetical protein
LLQRVHAVARFSDTRDVGFLRQQAAQLVAPDVRRRRSGPAWQPHFRSHAGRIELCQRHTCAIAVQDRQALAQVVQADPGRISGSERAAIIVEPHQQRAGIARGRDDDAR